MINKSTSHLILFDGVCNLCNGAVQTVINNDKKQIFTFASLQSITGEKVLIENKLSTDDFDSFVYLRNGKLFLRSSAALYVAKDLGGFSQLLFIFIIVPKFIRDFVYNYIAKNRYKWFGKQESCMVPTPELKSRFLD